MNKSFGVLVSLFISVSACTAETHLAQQGADTKVSTQPKSGEVVKQFFSAFGSGNIEGVVASFAPDATIVAVHAGPRQEGELYGTYTGTAGVRQFVANLGRTFDTKSFNVDLVASEGDIAFAKGSFSHVVKRSGKTFQSDWSLLCRVNAGHIVEYRFFEDSAAFVAADVSGTTEVQAGAGG